MSVSLLDKLKKTTRLPSPPGTALQILQICQKSEVDIGELADTIAADPALSVRILKYSNSALIGASREVTSVREAVVRLGVRSVRLMALSFSRVSDDDPRACQGFEYKAFWSYSVACAVGARYLAQRTTEVSPEEAFAGGLLAHLGKLVFAVGMPNEYAPVLAAAGGTLGDTEEAEAKTFEITHFELGSELLTEWGISPSLCDAVRHQGHSEGVTYNEKLKRFAHILNTATTLAKLTCKAVREDGIAGQLDALAETGFFESAETAGLAVEKIREEFTELARILDIQESAGRAIEDIQAEAGVVLEELSLAAQLKSDAVEVENENLQKQAWTDGLTKIANRAAFDQKLAEMCDAAVAKGKNICLAMLDVDHFKKFNDTHGHQTGDAVLQAVAGCLQPCVRSVDFVARYGGEEFAIILPNADQLTAAQICVKVRKAIESKTVAFDGKEHKVTASIGAALLCSPARKFDPAKLIEAADQQLYVSKKKGRNCCSMKQFGKPAAANPAASQPVGAGA